MATSSVSGPGAFSSVLKRRKPYEDRELVGLFELFDRLPPGDERATLSAIARDRLRSLFPRGQDQTGVTELASGLKIELDLGDLFGAEFYVGHCNETALVSALCKTLPPGARVVDVGANFGLYALHAARYAGKLSRTVAFEPAPRTFGLLEANIKRNRLSSRIKARRAAVSETPGLVTFHVAADQSFSGLRDTGRSPLRESVDVEQVSLDTDPAVIALGAIDFLKIDTEGGEAGVLAGAMKTIERSPSLVVLMEYSFKNLTAQQAVNVRKSVDDLLAKGLRGWTIDVSDEVAVLKSAAHLPSTFNGSLLLAGPKARWADAFIATLSETSVPAVADAGLAWSAAAGLLRLVRQEQQNVTTLERWSAKAGLPEGGPLGERVIKHIERLQADAKALSTRLEGAEATARSEQERHSQRQESERLKLTLKQAEVDWYSSRLEQQRRETDAMRALAEQRDAEVVTLHEKISALRGFMNRLSDQLQLKSEEVIRLMERRETDVAARGEVEAQWIKSMDALRAQLDLTRSELATARSENGQLQTKRLEMRGIIDDLNTKLKDLASVRASEASEYERQLADHAEGLRAAETKRLEMRGIIDDLNTKLKDLASVRASEASEYERQLADHAEGLRAAETKRLEMRVVIDDLNARLAQVMDEKAFESSCFHSTLAQYKSKVEAVEARRVELRVMIDGLNDKLQQAASLRSAEANEYERRLAEREEVLEKTEKRRAELRLIIDGLNDKLVQAAALRVSDAAAHQKRLRDREDSLRVELEAATVRIAELEENVRDSQEVVKALRSALESVNDRAESVAKRNAALGETLSARDIAVKELAATQERLEEQVGDLTSTLEERRTQIRTLQQRVALKALRRSS
jgi:FkbM family methyltransferase